MWVLVSTLKEIGGGRCGQCKVRADELLVIESGQINGSGHGGIGIVYQGLALACKSRTSIIGSEIGSWG